MGGSNTAESVEDYITKVIGIGDEGSRLLAKLSAPTLRNSKLVDIIQEGMNGIAVVRIPEDEMAVVHSVGGDPSINNIRDYAASMVDRLVDSANRVGLTPVGFANVIDAREGRREDIETIGRAIVGRADNYGLPVLNGELAILGDRVNGVANVMGTMISRCNGRGHGDSGMWVSGEGVTYSHFRHNGKAIFINSDGVGTKTEFYERSGKFEDAVLDFMAMNIDDASKMGAEVKVISGICETKGNIPFDKIRGFAWLTGGRFGFHAIVNEEYVGDRIRGYTDSADSYNISGSVVSTIDEERLRNPLKPDQGDHVIAIRGKPNPRSNGITDKRKLMTRMFGEGWHKTREGRIFLEYLAEPSTVFYPLFKELIDSGLATSVYHMSGGAYNGKFARPLAKHGLFVELNGLFEPDWRELTLAGAGFTSAQAAYAKWPMGNEGFITTKDPSEAIRRINSRGLEARIAGRVERREKIGIELVAYNGEKVYYPGK